MNNSITLTTIHSKSRNRRKYRRLQKLFVKLDHKCFNGEVSAKGYKIDMTDSDATLADGRLVGISGKRYVNIDWSWSKIAICNPNNRLIMTEDNMVGPELRAALLHEMLHAMLAVEGVDQDDETAHNLEFLIGLSRLVLYYDERCLFENFRNQNAELRSRFKLVLKRYPQYGVERIEKNGIEYFHCTTCNEKWECSLVGGDAHWFECPNACDSGH